MSEIVNLILSAEKPLILYNGLTDLMHLVDKFVMPIPSHVQGFKQLWQNVPILDLKFMAVNLLRTAKDGDAKPKVLCEQFQIPHSDNNTLESGYEAFTSARIFSAFLQRHFEGSMTKAVTSHVANKIFISFYGLAYLDLRREQADLTVESDD